MTKIKLALILSLFLTGCSMSDGELRNAYTRHYQQPDAYVNAYKQKIAGMDIDTLTQYAASEEKKKMGGQPRLKIDDSITVENIQAKGNRVVFDYSLSESWLSLSPQKQMEQQNTMRKDLIYRTCSLQTVRLAQERGLQEEHNYYSHYPDKISFTLRTSGQICIDNGFPQ
ncbi:hypothetical protein C3432_11470 [Citrobacter amalonaticus]|uniref:Lipoprotein n=1 Tax=Citrobacter amalonaticus TaxID=35703 RepID=A0A2S4S0S2_CITAM|nr:hypothetical protein [Citrobacter amalonaticus]POT58499.1 hypothetical protein C3432_11470 [Citrobacter amalonaticus]POT75975.1 hypothetical protein C3436_00350 [Citrobacter amalonaticus]POU67026.1 hypothetical protein C3430_09670 [Citrobacter amalonaticus]POV05210.1 hypothetical protein C3424_07655 [Citrobacter amalonaticus]